MAGSAGHATLGGWMLPESEPSDRRYEPVPVGVMCVRHTYEYLKQITFDFKPIDRAESDVSGHAGILGKARRTGAAA